MVTLENSCKFVINLNDIASLSQNAAMMAGLGLITSFIIINFDRWYAASGLSKAIVGDGTDITGLSVVKLVTSKLHVEFGGSNLIIVGTHAVSDIHRYSVSSPTSVKRLVCQVTLP